MRDPYDLKSIVSASYDSKDTMHDWTHIQRCWKSANKLVQTGVPDCAQDVLSCALILHGVIYEKGTEEIVREHLLSKTMAKDQIEKIIAVAWESQKDSFPDSVEGGILHDAHLLEGDDNFIITKVLATGSARGQKLKQTVDLFFDHIAEAHPQFYFELTAGEYANRMERARRYFSSLRTCL